MRRIAMLVSALAMVALCAVADTKETVTINGTALSQQATRMVFDGDNVTLTFSDGTSQTADMESVNVAFDYVAVFGDDADENLCSINTFGGKNVTAKVNRSFQAGQWATICLPFDMSQAQIADIFGQGTAVAKFNNFAEKAFYFTSTESIKAGVPYLIKPALETAPFTVEGVLVGTMAEGSTAMADGASFVGTLSEVSPQGRAFYLSDDSKLKLLANGTIIPLHAYIAQQSENTGLIKGDINGDKAVSVVDVMIVVGYIIGNVTEIVFSQADINGDGSIDVTDVMSIVWMILHSAESDYDNFRVFVDGEETGILFGGRGSGLDADANAATLDNNE